MVAPPDPLHLSPVADLAPAAGLRWLADLRPRALLADPALLGVLIEVLPEAELDAMARARGGVDLRAADELVVAGYDASTLFLAHQVVDPARLEAAFAARVAEVQGRAVDRNADDPRATVTRVWGDRGTKHEALVVFGREAAGLALGAEGPLRAAELFAEERLKRARPAWQAPPLDRVRELLGEAPVRAAAPGPFQGEWTAGLGGLLAAATAAGLAARSEGETIHVTLLLLGPWGDRAGEAEDRLKHAYQTLADSGLGRLLGIHDPAAPPAFVATPDALRIEAGLHARELVRGLVDATTAQVDAILGHSPAPTAAPAPSPRTATDRAH